jgi:hypothetical protein
VIALIVAGAVAGAIFAPVPVGPRVPDGVHITVYEPTRAAAIAACWEQLSWYLPGEADCMAAPESDAPDTTVPGWGRRLLPGWAQ